METIKSVLGLGGSASTSKEEPSPDQHPLSGEEPVSGQQGAGTATDPYDAGNSDGQSGLATGQTPDSLPKTTTSPDPVVEDNTSSPNPKESITSSNYPEPNSKPQDNLSSSPGLQGHPLPITSFTPTPTAEEVVSPYNYAPGNDNVKRQDNLPAQDTVPAQDTITARGTEADKDTVPAQGTESAQNTVSAQDVPAQNVVAAPDASSAKLDEQNQIKDNQPQSRVPEGSSDTAITDEVPQGKGSQVSSESKTFVEKEAARIAEETAPRNTTEDTGPSTSGTVNDTDHDLAESTKKLHLKDKIKEKLHFRKKSEST